jgi:hypothetical protein
LKFTDVAVLWILTFIPIFFWMFLLPNAINLGRYLITGKTMATSMMAQK